MDLCCTCGVNFEVSHCKVLFALQYLLSFLFECLGSRFPLADLRTWTMLCNAFLNPQHQGKFENLKCLVLFLPYMIVVSSECWIACESDYDKLLIIFDPQLH